jgi:ATP-dependent DNA helicase RecG
LIGGGETNRVELKVAPPRPGELAERMCGMANALGGYIIIGVEDGTLKIAGLTDTGAALDTILRAARQVQPSLALTPTEPEIYLIEGKKVVVATIPASLGPVYQASGVFWIRRGSHTIPLSYPEVVELGHERGLISWEQQPAHHATLKDLDLEKIKEHLVQRSSRRQHLQRIESIEEVLMAMGCAVTTSGGELRPTNTGLLFFGYDPQIQIPQSEIVCVLFKDKLGVGGYADRKIFYGPLKELIDQTEEFIEKHIMVGAKIVGWKRIDLPEYPKEALREAVINAVVHRDYSKTGEVIRIFKYTDRLEIRSPGLLLPGITVEQMEKGQVGSKLRNPILGNLLRDVPGYFERIGSGVRFMLEETRSMGMERPQFREMGEFVVTFWRNPELTEQPESGKLEESNPLLIDESEQFQRQTLAMKYVHENGGITNGEYIKLTGVSDRTALRDLEGLVSQGALRRVGKRRSSRYELPQ